MSELRLISKQREGLCDVLFIHGLDGDPITTWTNRNHTICWPCLMAAELPDSAICSLKYDAASTGWGGSAMPLVDRATNVLATLESHGFGKRPIVIIAHSLGGLLAKEIVRQGLELNTPAWQDISSHVRGIVFLATPHSGSGIAKLLRPLRLLIRGSVLLEELVSNDPALRGLNTWFRLNVQKLGIRSEVYVEKRHYFGLRVVNEASSDPGVPDVVPVPLDKNHKEICKIGRRDEVLHRRVREFIRSCYLSHSAQIRPQYTIYRSEVKLQMLWKQIRKPGGNAEPDLAAIRDSLARHEKLGTTTDPKEYITGNMSMRYGVLPKRPGLVFFGGTSEQVLVGLMGSPGSLIGADGTTPRLALMQYEQAFLDMIPADSAATGFPFRAATEHALSQLASPPRQVEFIARVIHTETGLLIASPLIVSLV